MPYNLRKRTRPEPVQAEVVEVKKRRVAVKKPRTAVVKTSKKEVLDVKETHDEPSPQLSPIDTEVPVAEPESKPAVVETKRKPAVEKRTKPAVEKRTKPASAETKSKPAVIETKSKPTVVETESKPTVVETESKATVVETKSKPTVVETKVSETSPNVMAFGVDSCGELGLGKIGIARKSPSMVPIGKPVKQVACGPMHILTLAEDGQVYTNGCNDEGALGRITDGDETLEATPTLVPINGKVIKVTAGDSHSAVLTDKEEVFIWGNFRDEHGSVGLTPSSEGQAVYEPTQILPDTKIMDIASGSNHMLLLDVKGNVYSFGVGAQGQLGRLKLEEIEKDGKSNSITAENRELFLNPHKVSLKDVDSQRAFICDAIYAGNCSSFATNTDKKKNRLAGWGSNNYYQLGYKGQKGVVLQPFPRRSTFTCSTSMMNVACGQHHTLFLTKTGRVYAAGRQDYGMLGLGKVDKEVCPAKPVDSHMMGDAPIIDISAGINVSFAVNDSGKLFSWGMGGTNLGLKDDQDLILPTEVKSLEGMKVLSVSAGGSFTSVVTN